MALADNPKPNSRSSKPGQKSWLSSQPGRKEVTRPILYRIYQIHRLLRSHRYPDLKSLVQKFEVSERTILRDLNTMRYDFGAPIAYSRQRRGYYYSDEKFTLPTLHLTQGEAIAIFLGERLLSQYRGTPFELAIRSAFEKISALLPEEISLDFSEVERLISFDVEPLRGEEKQLAEAFNLLSQAAHERRTVEMTYFSQYRGEETERQVDPYHLRSSFGAWYLIGYCHMRAEVRMFALDRIRDLRLTDQIFAIPEDFSVEEYLGDSLHLERGQPVEVAIKFDPYQARWIRERVWHPSQSIEELPDGSLILRMVVGSLGEVKRWAMSFGARAEVLEPERLREDICREIERVGEVYGWESGHS